MDKVKYNSIKISFIRNLLHFLFFFFLFLIAITQRKSTTLVAQRN